MCKECITNDKFLNAGDNNYGFCTSAENCKNNYGSYYL